MTTTWKGTRRMAPWEWEERTQRRSYRRQRTIIGVCRICGQPVRGDESYHVNSVGLAHLRCEYRR